MATDPWMQDTHRPLDIITSSGRLVATAQSEAAAADIVTYRNCHGRLVEIARSVRALNGEVPILAQMAVALLAELGEE